MTKCTNFGCEEDAHYFDKHHTEIALCWKHAAARVQALAPMRVYRIAAK